MAGQVKERNVYKNINCR